jgi:hypothetical protein
MYLYYIIHKKLGLISNLILISLVIAAACFDKIEVVSGMFEAANLIVLGFLYFHFIETKITKKALNVPLFFTLGMAKIFHLLISQMESSQSAISIKIILGILIIKIIFNKQTKALIFYALFGLFILFFMTGNYFILIPVTLLICSSLPKNLLFFGPSRFEQQTLMAHVFLFIYFIIMSFDWALQGADGSILIILFSWFSFRLYLSNIIKHTTRSSQIC